MKAKKKIPLPLYRMILVQLQWNFIGQQCNKKGAFSPLLSSCSNQNDITRIHQVNVGNAARNFQRHYAHFKGLIIFLYILNSD